VPSTGRQVCVRARMRACVQVCYLLSFDLQSLLLQLSPSLLLCHRLPQSLLLCSPRLFRQPQFLRLTSPFFLCLTPCSLLLLQSSMTTSINHFTTTFLPSLPAHNTVQTQYIAFTMLKLLVGVQEKHAACKKSVMSCRHKVQTICTWFS